MRLALYGVAIGVAAALAVGHLGRSLLFQISGSDPLTLAAVGLLLVVVSLTASLIPAWRATRVDPMEALRDD